ncbi:MAG: sulfatase-like hydrolase/transferase [Lachnospiraceae bacterium]|nr:sulfatase-like hydrolase/transferase [Lachnospiraceae bacterium]
MEPNVICFVADHLRYDVLRKGYTPHIDRLMADSVSFDRMYCGSPLCVPARGALFTGTYPGVNGSLINGWYQPDKHLSLVKEGFDNLYGLMEESGRECIHSGKQHLFVEGIQLEQREDTRTKWLSTEKTYKEFVKAHGRRLPGGPGFRSQVPELRSGRFTEVTTYSNGTTGRYEEGEKYYFDRYFTDLALDELKKFDRKKPLFLSMMYLAPHPPFDIPDPWYSMVDRDAVDLPENVGVWYPHQSPLQKYNVTGAVGSIHTMEQWRESWRTYLGLVALLDQCVGDIVQSLKEKGLYDNSIILFCSDHGEMLGSHCLFQKMCMYEESARTPFSIHLPGGEGRGRVVKEAVSHIDFLPTVCDYLGLETAHPMNGVSLRSYLEGGTGEERPVFIQYDGNGSQGNFQRCVVAKGHKLIVDLFKDESFYELYDLEHDCLETENLIFKNGKKELAGELYQMLLRHMEEISDYLVLPPVNFDEFCSRYQ